MRSQFEFRIKLMERTSQCENKHSFSGHTSSVMERTRGMIQASLRNFNRLRSSERLRASVMATLLHEL